MATLPVLVTREGVAVPGVAASEQLFRVLELVCDGMVFVQDANLVAIVRDKFAFQTAEEITKVRQNNIADARKAGLQKDGVEDIQENLVLILADLPNAEAETNDDNVDILATLLSHGIQMFEEGLQCETDALLVDVSIKVGLPEEVLAVLQVLLRQLSLGI